MQIFVFFVSIRCFDLFVCFWILYFILFFNFSFILQWILNCVAWFYISFALPLYSLSQRGWAFRLLPAYWSRFVCPNFWSSIFFFYIYFIFYHEVSHIMKFFIMRYPTLWKLLWVRSFSKHQQAGTELEPVHWGVGGIVLTEM